MANNKYEIARGNYSPTPSYEQEAEGAKKSNISSETAQRYLSSIRSLIDERIERRIRDGQDIAKVYSAEIIKKIIDVEYGGIVTSVTVRYNDDDRVEISNETVRVLDSLELSNNNRWCKICTYDNVQFYILHRM